MKDKKIDVVSVNEFGICPICGNRFMLLKSAYCAYTLSDSGWITAMVDDKVEFKVICTNCGYTCDMEVTVNGLTPKDSKIKDSDTRKPILKDNPIGKIIVEDNF